VYSVGGGYGVYMLRNGQGRVPSDTPVWFGDDVDQHDCIQRDRGAHQTFRSCPLLRKPDAEKRRTGQQFEQFFAQNGLRRVSGRSLIFMAEAPGCSMVITNLRQIGRSSWLLSIWLLIALGTEHFPDGCDPTRVIRVVFASGRI
jgi:hypothetical protein